MTEVSVETCFGNLKSVVVFLKILTCLLTLRPFVKDVLKWLFSHMPTIKFCFNCLASTPAAHSLGEAMFQARTKII